jgi:hypothetical protein
VVVVALCLGGSVLVSAFAPPPATKSNGGPAPATAPAIALPAAPATSPAESPSAGGSTTDPTGPAAPPSTVDASPTVVTTTVTETKAIPYPTKRVNDSTLAAGTTKVRTHGVAGVSTLTYQVTLTNGVQTAKTLVSQKTTKAPVTEVVAVGTKKKAPQCDPNYTGACVPIASDVDCAGGGGDGPAYVQGPVYVVGKDIYGLDRDHDGVGCED